METPTRKGLRDEVHEQQIAKARGMKNMANQVEDIVNVKSIVQVTFN